MPRCLALVLIASLAALVAACGGERAGSPRASDLPSIEGRGADLPTERVFAIAVDAAGVIRHAGQALDREALGGSLAAFAAQHPERKLGERDLSAANVVLRLSGELPFEVLYRLLCVAAEEAWAYRVHLVAVDRSGVERALPIFLPVSEDGAALFAPNQLEVSIVPPRRESGELSARLQNAFEVLSGDGDALRLRVSAPFAARLRDVVRVVDVATTAGFAGFDFQRVDVPDESLRVPADFRPLVAHCRARPSPPTRFRVTYVGEGSLPRTWSAPPRPGPDEIAAAAADRALKFLVRRQADDGGWWGRVPDRRVALTSEALLALLARGNTLRKGRFKNSAKSAVKWLRRQLREDGRIGDRLRDQSVAAFAMCEAYRLSRYKTMRKLAQASIDHLLRSDVRDEWRVFALISAQDARLAVPEKVLRELPRDVESIVGSAGGDHLASARELILRYSVLQDYDDPRVAPVIERVLGRPPGWGRDGLHSYRYWLYASHGMFVTGRDAWRAWRPVVFEMLQEQQRTEDDLAGSFDPLGDSGRASERIHATAFAVMTLATPQHLLFRIR